jgi:hypothetical protein
MEYDAKLILHLHNEVHIKKDKSKLFVEDLENQRLLPIIKCIFGKNKLNSFKGADYFIMDNTSGIYTPITYSKVKELEESNMEYGDAMLNLVYGMDKNEYDESFSGVEAQNMLQSSSL